MTTLSSDALRPIELGDVGEHLMVASDIIYDKAAVGLVKATGLARPLVGGDVFAGFAEKRADNASGAAGAKTVRVLERGKVQLPVSGAVVTDVRQPVYAQDDDTFSLIGTGGTFIGFASRFVSAGIMIVKFDVHGFQDPYGGGPYESVGANKTLDAEDTGKTFFVTADAVVVTLPAIAAGLDSVTIVNGVAFGGALVEVAPQAADSILGPDITAADDKSLLNTKATAGRGDLLRLGLGDADGYVVRAIRGTWAREA